MRLCFVTTFPNKAWAVYAREGLESLRRFLPREVKICVGLDDEALQGEVKAILAPSDELICHWQPDHRAFVSRYGPRDHPSEYRLKATPFCHKVFFTRDFFEHERTQNPPPDFLIWWDADAILQRPVSLQELAALMPRADEACSYLGRKDWDHSECGFIAYNMRHPGARAILDFMYYYYTEGLVFSLPQWHDSYLFDVARQGQKCRNISEGISGNNVWAATPLGAFSEHRKGVEAKQRGQALRDEELFREIKKA